MNDSTESHPIRVLMLFTILNRGGAETMVMNYYRAIDRSKVQFDFVVHREEEGDYEEEIRSLGGKIYRMMPLRPHTFSKYEKQIAAFFDEHPEYHIIHGQCSESGYFFYKEASRRGIPVIIAHAHNSHVKFDLRWIVRTWMKHQMRPYLTHYFACGEEAAEWLFGKQLAKKAIILRNAVDTQDYHFDAQLREEKRKELGLAPTTLVLCHIGRFDKVKNHVFILEIFGELLKKRPDAQLLLIGDGDLREQTEKKASQKGLLGKVRFLGVRRDVNELLQAADAMIFPSLFEGLPVTLVEAQCTGLPCVISKNIPSEAVLTDLVEQVSLSESVAIWAEKLITATTQPHNRPTYAERVAAAGFDIKSNSQWLEDFYLNVNLSGVKGSI
ncbi:MAG: glycosyltransferase family 1 protein [Prevotella sp.]|nr:glycosyltransferase family 1 protein [Prevotella sp.]